MSKTSLVLAVASLLVSGSAFADEFYFSDPGTVTWNGVFVNPYSANNITHPAHNPLTIYCDDWNADFSGNPTWNADVYTLTAGNLSHFKFGDTTPKFDLTLSGGVLNSFSNPTPDPFQRYLEVAWLNEQWRQESSSNDLQSAKEDKQKRIFAAGWTLFVNSEKVDGLIGAINTSGYGTDVYDYLGAAQTAVAGGYLAPGWDVVVPVGLNSNGQEMQEFLVHMPEPGSVILLGTVAGFVAFTKFRHKRQA
jgi:hypothetical protein